jgi:[Skp1-protein]-hydroxyproline N-acetylglucosaminyltransferase
MKALDILRNIAESGRGRYNGGGNDNSNKDDDSSRNRRRERLRERRERRSNAGVGGTSVSAYRDGYYNYHSADRGSNGDVTTTTSFLVLVALLALALLVQFAIVFGWHHARHDERVLHGRPGGGGGGGEGGGRDSDNREIFGGGAEGGGYDPKTAHLIPKLPPLPPILNVRNISPGGRDAEEALMDGVLSGERPTIAGIALLLSNFLGALRSSNKKMASRGPPHRVQRDEVHESFARLAKEHLGPFEDAYRDRSIFPVRDDDSIFVSIASFRDHLLGDTLIGAFDQAKFPDKLYVGVVVQNCLGLDPYDGEPGSQCRTGAQVVGKGPNGHDLTEVSDAPPDKNGIEQFCDSPQHERYCESGQVRALYLHEDESLGPAMARYYASKLWGGETYFVQVDSHLEFYEGWDELYINELKATGSYPMAMLSSYPPGFGHTDEGKLEGEASNGSRLCTCEFSTNDVEDHIIRINSGASYNGDEVSPTQIPFVAAGFFFAPARFLLDVPFDPYLPW